MERIVDTKYKTVSHFRQTLNCTSGQTLIHPVNDTFWGTGSYNQRGADMFGKILMRIRDRNQPRPPPAATQPPSSLQVPKPNPAPTKTPSSLQVPQQTPAAPSVINSISIIPDSTPVIPAVEKSSKKKRTLDFSPEVSPTVPRPTKRTCPSTSPQPSTSAANVSLSSPTPGISYAAVAGKTPSGCPTTPRLNPAPVVPPPKQTYASSPLSTGTSKTSTVSPSPKLTNATSPLSTGTSKTRYPPAKHGVPWVLPKLTKHTVIIGDSNLSRITDFTNNQVEIHSFPGMTLSQANKLIENYPHGADSQDPATQPRDFIISVGINDRANASSTTRTCINKIYYSCRRKFPNSRVCMPEVNCDQCLQEHAWKR